MNKSLLLVEEQWNREVVEPCLKSLCEDLISHPYCMGVVNEYIDSNMRIMIVGQEPDGLTEYYEHFSQFGTQNRQIGLQSAQDWSIRYQEKQLYNRGNEEKNNSPFWTLFRDLVELGFVPCWNNIDNVHRIVDNKTESLTIALEEILNSPYGSDQKTLLQKQIDIVNPNAIWFVTGPHYIKTMAYGLQVKLTELEEYAPSANRLVTELNGKVGEKIKAFWSYHPKYLNHKGARKSVCEFVANNM